MKRLLYSVRFRLTLWYAGVLAVVLALFAVSIYLLVVRTLQSNVDEALRGYGQKVQQAALPHVHGRRLDLKHVSVPPPGTHAPIAAILFMNFQNQTRAVQHGKVGSDLQPLRITLRSGREECGTLPTSTENAVGGRALRYCTFLVQRKGHRAGGIEVVESLTGVNKTLDRLRLALLFGFPLALLLAGAGGWILAGRALEPVDHISRMARSITATDLSKRINLDQQDELGRLAGTFDEMIGRLERAFREQRQLTADVSHELRSPLTILEAQTTLALRRSRTPEEYQYVLRSVQEEVERMTAMVAQLLLLARADAGEEHIDRRPVDLVEVARATLAGVKPVAEQKNIGLEIETVHEAWLHGDPTRLRHLLLNLLDNALRHTASGGQVRVQITCSGVTVTLTVLDTGEGIGEEDLPHIFQRFYRGDRARRRGTGNSGLGLPIAKWIAEAHDGSLSVHSAPGEGTAVTLAVPALNSGSLILMMQGRDNLNV